MCVHTLCKIADDVHMSLVSGSSHRLRHECTWRIVSTSRISGPLKWFCNMLFVIPYHWCCWELSANSHNSGLVPHRCIAATTLLMGKMRPVNCNDWVHLIDIRNQWDVGLHIIIRKPSGVCHSPFRLKYNYCTRSSNFQTSHIIMRTAWISATQCLWHRYDVSQTARNETWMHPHFTAIWVV